MKKGLDAKIEERLRCGVVMPISALDSYDESHWSDVRAILFEAIEEAGFEPNLVSDADDIGIIQKRIIQNLYENPIVVCDVSGKNPNVMFELGLRLAFDKPTIIIKDTITAYSFDTSPIEHLVYPKDLRFSQIVEFKAQLIDKIHGTHKRATKDPEYTTFLKHFGDFTVAKIDTKEIPTSEFIIEELQNLRKAISDINKSQSVLTKPTSRRRQVLCLQKSNAVKNEKIASLLKPFGEFTVQKKSDIHYHFDFVESDSVNWNEILKLGKSVIPNARLLTTSAP